MSRLLLSVDGCRIRYGAVVALNGVSLRLGAGDTLGLVGPLAAGKTSLLRTIAGLVPAAEGEVRYMDRELRTMPPDERQRAGIVFVPADGGIFPTLTVRENLALAAHDDASVAAVSAQFPVLGERAEQRAGSLSGGEQRQLAIARGALARPRLLLLDEPLLGLSPIAVQRVITLLLALRAGGTAMIVVEERPSPDLVVVVGQMLGMRSGRIVPLEDVATPPPLAGTPQGSLDWVEVETLAIPLSTRDRRALQTLAQASGEQVGALVAGLIREHVAKHDEVWR